MSVVDVALKHYLVDLGFDMSFSPYELDDELNITAWHVDGETYPQPTPDDIAGLIATVRETGAIADWDKFAATIAASPAAGTITDQASASPEAVSKLAEMAFLVSNENLRNSQNILATWAKLEALLLSARAAGQFVLPPEIIASWNQLIDDCQAPTALYFTV